MNSFYGKRPRSSATTHAPLLGNCNVIIASLLRIDRRHELYTIEFPARRRPSHHERCPQGEDQAFEPGCTSPDSYASTTTCTRSRSPSLERIRPTCDFTVASEP